MSVIVKENTSIQRKIALIFIAIIILEAALFMICLSIMMRRIKKNATLMMLSNRMSYIESVTNKYSLDMTKEYSSDDAWVIYVSNIDTNDYTVEEGFYDLISRDNIKPLIEDIIENNIESGEISGIKDSVFFQAKTIDDILIIVASDGSYLNNVLLSNIYYIVIIFVVIFAIGSIIILTTIRSFVVRINKICDFVQKMPANNYRDAFIDDGDDEIEILSRKIDDMRRTINKDEANKDLMLQNISHDLKTPIAVIRSYAEAIEDGVLETSKAEVIIDQSNKLEKKVKNLIEFNKLEYLSYQGSFDEVEMKPIILEVIDNYRFVTSDVEFVVDLDDSKLIGKQENYYTIIENIIENSIRYAQKEIKVTLKNQVLTIHNDGEPIGEDFVKKGFRPYEKGHNGKFGLGMSIVSKSLEYFGMALKVKNENGGVTFMIHPKGGKI